MDWVASYVIATSAVSIVYSGGDNISCDLLCNNISLVYAPKLLATCAIARHDCPL